MVADEPAAAEPTATDEPTTVTPPPPAEEEDPPLGPESTTIGHVWLVALQGPGAAEAVSAIGGGGVQLQGARTVTEGGLANALALTAGATPTPRTRSGCRDAQAAAAGAAPASDDPCALPAGTASIPAALGAAQRPWRAYLDAVPEGRAAGAAPPAGICDLPPAGDAAAIALSARSPFAHLTGLREGGACATAVRSLGQLDGDLADAGTTAVFSYLALGGCVPPGAPPKPLADQLRDAVVSITTSRAYGQDGLLVVTTTDGAAPCGAPATPAQRAATGRWRRAATGNRAVHRAAFPGDPQAPAGVPSPTVVYSPWSEAGSTSTVAYDGFSIARTVATVLGVAAPGAAADGAVPTFGNDVLGRAAPGATDAESRAAAARTPTNVPRR
ncbi:hypothetical protein PAI11_15240 [Patulibacter medicamentivorans]|uniref:Uncharacterized protein n=1 Tax=Patulibacter medicamentivorans TaxID=1097667 RepID=H0E3Z8_9ACTN|nr:hypothetical protein PAI11_15240 [Patulibacter medicamentivorans]